MGKKVEPIRRYDGALEWSPLAALLARLAEERAPPRAYYPVLPCAAFGPRIPAARIVLLNPRAMFLTARFPLVSVRAMFLLLADICTIETELSFRE